MAEKICELMKKGGSGGNDIDTLTSVGGGRNIDFTATVGDLYLYCGAATIATSTTGLSLLSQVAVNSPGFGDINFYLYEATSTSCNISANGGLGGVVKLS